MTASEREPGTAKEESRDKLEKDPGADVEGQQVPG